MKKAILKISLLVFLNILITLTGYTQCKNKEDVPDELFRKRYKPTGMRYGNPYTMFSTTSQPLDEMLTSLISN